MGPGIDSWHSSAIFVPSSKGLVSFPSFCRVWFGLLFSFFFFCCLLWSFKVIFEIPRRLLWRDTVEFWRSHNGVVVGHVGRIMSRFFDDRPLSSVQIRRSCQFRTSEESLTQLSWSTAGAACASRLAFVFFLFLCFCFFSFHRRSSWYATTWAVVYQSPANCPTKRLLKTPHPKHPPRNSTYI